MREVCTRDVLMLKPIDDLLDAGLVFGAEKKIPDMAEVANRMLHLPITRVILFF